MKKCIDCKQEKSFDNFPFDKSRHRYLSVCRPCTAIRTEYYRQTHKDKWKESDRKNTAKFRACVDIWKSQGCVKCGDTRSYVIDAHHKDPSKKDFSIGTVKRTLPLVNLELEKCVPLCSNCHREFHYLKISLNEYLKK